MIFMLFYPLLCMATEQVAVPFDFPAVELSFSHSYSPRGAIKVPSYSEGEAVMVVDMNSSNEALPSFIPSVDMAFIAEDENGFFEDSQDEEFFAIPYDDELDSNSSGAGPCAHLDELIEWLEGNVKVCKEGNSLVISYDSMQYDAAIITILNGTLLQSSIVILQSQPFELLERVAFGSTGVVYKAINPLAIEKGFVAIKFTLLIGRNKSFELECYLNGQLGRLDGHGILSTFAEDAETILLHSPLSFSIGMIASTFFEGSTLNNLDFSLISTPVIKEIKEKGEAAIIEFSQITKHLHNDLVPENFIISLEPVCVYIIDFDKTYRMNEMFGSFADMQDRFTSVISVIIEEFSNKMLSILKLKDEGIEIEWDILYHPAVQCNVLSKKRLEIYKQELQAFKEQEESNPEETRDQF